MTTSVGTTMRSLRSAVDSMVKKIAEEVRQTAQSNTPKRTGRAQAGWRGIRKTAEGFSVRNRVPYIGLLDDDKALGRPRSRQAPDGIIKPTFDKVKRKRRRL